MSDEKRLKTEKEQIETLIKILESDCLCLMLLQMTAKSGDLGELRKEVTKYCDLQMKRAMLAIHVWGPGNRGWMERFAKIAGKRFSKKDQDHLKNYIAEYCPEPVPPTPKKDGT